MGENYWPYDKRHLTPEQRAIHIRQYVYSDEYGSVVRRKFDAKTPQDRIRQRTFDYSHLVERAIKMSRRGKLEQNSVLSYVMLERFYPIRGGLTA